MSAPEPASPGCVDPAAGTRSGAPARAATGLGAFGILLGILLAPEAAWAQYRSGQLGFEGGYQFIEDDFGLSRHAPFVGLRAGYKAEDHWWFTARAAVSFRSDVPFGVQNTVVLFHLTPVETRYYFLTDSVRPFVGFGTSFHFLINSDLPSTVQWGFGPSGGVELKLRRDLFLGLQVDGLYMLAFDSPENPEVLNATVQLLFFL